MRHSPLKHPVAVLRQIVGLGQKEFGKLVNRSPRTIQSIELGRHALSSELARRIAVETGVSIAWLLDGNAKVEPYVWGADEIPYTKEHYERTRGLIARGINPTVLGIVGEEALKHTLGEEEFQRHLRNTVFFEGNWLDRFQTMLRQLFAAIAAADRVGREEIAEHRLSEFVDRMKKDFGQAVDSAFLDRYNEFLTGCADGTEDTKTLIKEDGDILWSPYLEKSQWKETNDIVDVMFPPGSNVLKYLEAHGRKAFETVLTAGLKMVKEEHRERKRKRNNTSEGRASSTPDGEAPEYSPPKMT